MNEELYWMEGIQVVHLLPSIKLEDIRIHWFINKFKNADTDEPVLWSFSYP